MISNNLLDSLHYLIYEFFDLHTPSSPTTDSIQTCAHSKIESQIQSVIAAPSSIGFAASVQKSEKPLALFNVSPNQTALQTQDIDHAFSILQSHPIEEVFQKLEWNTLYDKDNLFICMLGIGSVSIGDITRFTRTPKFIKEQGLSECECTKAVWRDKTESAILSRIESRFNNHKQRLTYVSIGSGECFQDWIILCKLILLGYTNVESHLCDIEYGKGSYQTACQTMEKFFTHFPDISYTIHFHSSFREFAELQKPVDVVLALDFNGDIDDTLPPPKLLLNPNGFTYCTAKCKKNQPRWDTTDNNNHFFTYWLMSTTTITIT
jgi:hypothetical protein